jgi:hypothetical protein
MTGTRSLPVARWAWRHARVQGRRSDLEAFLAYLLSLRSTATAASRDEVLGIFYRWLEEEEEISASPMARIKAPSSRNSRSR